MREQKRQKKEQVIAAVAVIFDKAGKVLLTKRHEPNKIWHGKWQFPGGGIEYGEHPIDAIHREIEEETGLKIELLSSLPLVHSVLFQEYNKHVIILVFPARHISGEVDVGKDIETSDAQWYFIHEIDYSLCLPEVKELLEKTKVYIMK